MDQAHAVDLYAKKTDNFAARFRKQAQSNENDLKVIKVQYEQLQQQYVNDLRQLEAMLARTRDDIAVIESRRITESQAFAADISSIKKRVINFERYIKRIKQHVDEERTADLIAELENTGVAQVDMKQLIADIRKVMNEVKEAKRFTLPK